ncbi:unnamed protein product [Rotaria magnacalcarata]|uniref:Uncharacterized protein n=2 Tax=Rotaria magnacalcarata TaxID=392030 RepID=A0A816BQS2_9BILA|nr:unnamed protein product [Rotaria magnacalcarata]CAF4489291.1 unnamed protein product [Rotaria magnacalcarata]
MAAVGDTCDDKEVLKFKLQLVKQNILLEKEKTKRLKIEKEKALIEKEMVCEQVKAERIKLTLGNSSLSTSNIVNILSNHSNYYTLFVIDHIQPFNINNVLNDKNYLNENTIDLIRNYFNTVSSLLKIDEGEIQSAFENLMLNLLNSFNDFTLLKYLDTHKSCCINGKFRPDCCFSI